MTANEEEARRHRREVPEKGAHASAPPRQTTSSPFQLHRSFGLFVVDPADDPRQDRGQFVSDIEHG